MKGIVTKPLFLCAVCAGLLSLFAQNAIGNVISDFTTEEVCLAAAKDAGLKGFAMALRLGFWKRAKAIVQNSAPNPEFKNVFEGEQRVINNELANLKSVIESSLPMKIVSPAFQWAQSANEVLLSVKFSHKIDAPATLNVVANNVNITSDRLLLQASDGRKMFQLEMEFFGSVEPSESTWSMASVGRMTFTIKKSAASRWLSLTKGNKKLPQMHFWWEMQEKYAKELDKLEADLKKEKEKEKEKEQGTASVDDVSVAGGSTSEASSSSDSSAAADGGADAGRIVSDEELALKAELKRIEDKYKKEAAVLADEARKRKKDIDAKAKEEKSAVDTEIAEKKKQLEEQAMKEKLTVDPSLATATNKDEL